MASFLYKHSHKPPQICSSYIKSEHPLGHMPKINSMPVALPVCKAGSFEGLKQSACNRGPPQKNEKKKERKKGSFS